MGRQAQQEGESLLVVTLAGVLDFALFFRRFTSMEGRGFYGPVCEGTHHGISLPLVGAESNRPAYKRNRISELKNPQNICPMIPNFLCNSPYRQPEPEPGL